MVKTRKEVLQTVHHALLAHGLGCQAIRAASPGRAMCPSWTIYDSYIPVIETPENIAAARKAFIAEEHNGTVLVPALTGNTIRKLWAELGRRGPDVPAATWKPSPSRWTRLASTFTPAAMSAPRTTPADTNSCRWPKGIRKMHMPWLNFVPESLYWGVRLVGEALRKKDLPICIRENGCATEDEITPRGEVLDLGRILYMRSYLRKPGGRLPKAIRS